MNDLSIIITCRDDNYGGQLIERLTYTLKNNINLFKKHNINFEYIVVDWVPLSPNRYLYLHPKLRSFFNEPYVKCYIVDNSVLIKEKITSKRFYEYFAKNTGMRRASKKYLFVTNIDILLNDNSVQDIAKLLNEEESVTKNYFYRCNFRTSYSLNNNTLSQPLNTIDLQAGCVGDKEICGYAAGDFLLLHQSNNIGYNESDVEHRKNQKQSGMDSELLWSLYGRGRRLKFINGNYGHIEHAPSYERLDIYRLGIKYDNKDSWGFINYPTKEINEKTTIIYSE